MVSTQELAKLTARRYSPEEPAAAVHIVRTPRAELETEHGTVHRVRRRSAAASSWCG